jgi:tubulin-like protein CetZ
MKLAVVGLGQCGGRIADEFVRLNRLAREWRHIEFLVTACAVNTDTADLAGLTAIKPLPDQRILIGAATTRGHGVAKMSDAGAEIMNKDADKVINALRKNSAITEADAFMLVTATAGGTGAGATPVLARVLKERLTDKPVYAIAVLPFEHEEANEERSVYNSAVCLKSLSQVADAVMLVDNQRYVSKDQNVNTNLQDVNKRIAQPFLDLLCAGEEVRPKHVGAKTLDAGDITQTLSGWSAIGYGERLKVLVGLPKDVSSHFVKRGTKTEEGIQAMDQALGELSIEVDPAQARRALLSVAGPREDISLGMVKDLLDYLKMIVPQANIRSGDYPREKGVLDVTLILSEFGEVPKLQDYYRQASRLLREQPGREVERAAKADLTREAGKDVPTLE